MEKLALKKKKSFYENIKLMIILQYGRAFEATQTGADWEYYDKSFSNAFTKVGMESFDLRKFKKQKIFCQKISYYDKKKKTWNNPKFFCSTLYKIKNIDFIKLRDNLLELILKKFKFSKRNLIWIKKMKKILKEMEGDYSITQECEFK